MSFSPLITELIRALQVLPGIGPKSAQRMVLHLLQRRQKQGLELAQALTSALSNVQNCKKCQIFCEQDICGICQDPKRDSGLLCVVHSASDVLAIENTRKYQGRYFVLHGQLSPFDGIGPEQLGLDKLDNYFSSGEINEVVMATNTTVEGEVTTYYINDLLKAYPNIKITRIAQGVPLGGELEYLDARTLGHALGSRHPLTEN